MVATLAAILSFLLGDFALPVAKAIALGWTRLTTWPAPEDDHDRQLAEFAADVESEIDHHLRSGQEPAQVAAILLIRNAPGAMGDTAEALPPLIRSLTNMKERDMAMQILVAVALIAGALLGVAGWFNGPNPEAGLHMFILAGIVGVAGGFVAPMVAIAAVLGD